MCEVCHGKYGEPDGNRHKSLEKVEAVPATATSTGIMEHWHCTACGKFFADAAGKREISAGDTVIKKTAPTIVEGTDGKWSRGDEGGLTFRSDAVYADFIEVLVDGEVVSSEDYEKREGGIVIELKPGYLGTLSEGDHTLTIRSAGGDAVADFSVLAETDQPTDGTTHVWDWVIVAVAVFGVGAAAAVLVIRKKKAV